MSKEAAHAVVVDQAHVGNPARAGYLEDVAERSGLFVAYDDKYPVGYCCIDHGYFFHRPFVSLLVVHPDHRRAGIGEALLRHAESEAAGARLFTSTNRSNAPMIALLEKRGFAMCGELAGLDDGDPEIVFAKDV